MTQNERKEAIKCIKTQLENGYVDVSGIHYENELKIIEQAMTALGAIEQYRWERDVAIRQLRELGLELGLKTDDVQQAINFKKYFDELYGEGLEVANWHLNGDLEPFDNFYENALQNGN